MISWRRLLGAGSRGVIGVAMATAMLSRAPAPSPAHADPHTIVSLEFDDGWQDATVAGALLAARMECTAPSSSSADCSATQIG